jgi:hypothetical protein
MNKIIFTLFGLIACVFSVDAQVIFSEDFESIAMPVDWQNNSNATDGGWRFGTNQSLSSQAFGIPSNGTRITATNDDQCNCNKANEYLISKPIDLSTEEAAILKFDLFYTDQEFQGVQEDATVEISLDGISWTILDDLHGHGSWDQHIVNITDYVGNSTVYIGFRYDDNGGWLYGMAIDNVIIEIPNKLDVSLVELDEKDFGEIGKEFKISGTVLNNGIETINSMEVQYTIGSNPAVFEQFDNLNIEGFEFNGFEFSDFWIPSEEGSVDVIVEILTVNGSVDENADNNSGSFNIDIFGDIVVPNNILQIVNSEPTIKTVATASNGLDRPTDLDFFPVLGKDELWVVNQRTENVGGSTVTISGATLDTPSNFDQRVDGNSWHFMSLPTGIAFSDDNFNFATSTGVKDANHNGGTFTGPTLWSSDPEIYALPSGGNGSHLDMLHGSPFSMGIAHEVDNVFWVYDDYNGDIVRYDFGEDHGPGNDDHADGKLKRYGVFGIQKDGDIPNHMILDKSTNWLYFVDNGNSRVMRLDINSGIIGSFLPNTNEALAEHIRMSGFISQAVITEGLDQPCGLELFEGYLLVGNYGNGHVTVYDVENNFDLIGRIETGLTGLTGIKIAPNGNIFALSRTQNRLISISEGTPTSTVENNLDKDINIYPNPARDYITIDIKNNTSILNANVVIYNNQGQKMTSEIFSQNGIVDISELTSGIYILELTNSELLYKKRFSIIK